MKQIPKKLYIDIDGVLLARNGSLANNAQQFLEWANANFDCYWLTTRDRSGHKNIVAAFKHKLPYSLVTDIHATQWETLKTEAINIKSDFYWIDDGLLATEREIVGNRWISVNINKNPNGLLNAWEILRSKV